LLDNYPEKRVYTYGLEKIDNPEFLEDMDNPSLDIIRSSLTIVLDTSTFSRTDDKSYAEGLKSLKIDHHLDSEECTDYRYVVESASSTSELIAQLAIVNDWYISSKSASYLYAGMNFDTRGFTIASVNATTFKILAVLVEKGIDLVQINRYINDLAKEKFAIKHYLATKAIFKEDVGYILLTREEKLRLGLSTHEAKDFVYVMENIKGINKYAFFSYEEDSDSFSASLRSHRPSIVEIARQYGGGGHRLACGIPELNLKQVEEVIDLLVKARD
ncbi:MAG TPA: DHH family phosphoesterase, partial [Erysipelotrichaceae bacterium]|nr:DHH family phosphoesterase [Erysipelotrichaceae bacterium]